MGGISRRSVLRSGTLGLAGAAVGGLAAACGSKGFASSTAQTRATTTARNPAPTPAAATTPAPGAIPSATPSAEGPAKPWSTTIPGIGPFQTLAYAAGTVLVATLDGMQGLDSGTGAKRWESRLRTVSHADDIAIIGGTAYLSASDLAAGKEAVEAVDLATGRAKSVFDAPSDVALNGVGGVRGGVLYVAVFDNGTQHREVWAVDVASGGVRWKTPCPDDNTHLFVPAAGSLVFSSAPDGAGFTALDAGSGGKVVWSQSANLAIGASVTVAEGTAGAVILSVDANAGVSGLDPATGDALWRVSPPPAVDGTGTNFQQVFSPGGDVYYCWDGGQVAARRVADLGEPLWRTPVRGSDGSLNTEMAFDGRTLFIVGDGLYALDTATGAVRWHRTAASLPGFGPDAALAAGGGHCFVRGFGPLLAIPSVA